MTNKNRFEMDQTFDMNLGLNEKNEIEAKNRIDHNIGTNEEHNVHAFVQMIEHAGMEVIYSCDGMNMKNETQGSFDVIDLTPMNYRIETRLDLQHLHTAIDSMEPITVSRKVTHRRRRKTGKRAGRVSMLLGACALTLGLTAAAPSAGAQKLEQGIRSEHVVQLQEQLSELGYFDAGITGYYGSITKSAVRDFQQAQGLSADGVAGPITLEKLNKKVKAEGETLRQLAKLIHGEARGESFEGQVAVGAVVLNRVQSGEFPSSISEVIFQKGQFTAVDDGQFNLKPTATSFKAARQALNGVDPTNGALYYYNPKIATSEWSKSRPTLLTIGQHDFTR